MQRKKILGVVLWRLLQGSTIKPNEHLGMELPGLGSASMECSLINEVKDNDLILVFLAENKANQN